MKQVYKFLIKFNQHFDEKAGWFFTNGRKNDYSKEKLIDDLNKIDLVKQVNIKTNAGFTYICEKCETKNNTWLSLYYRNLDQKIKPMSKFYISYCEKCGNHTILDLNIKKTKSNNFFYKKNYFQS